MTLGSWASRCLVLSCLALVACSSSSDGAPATSSSAKKKAAGKTSADSGKGGDDSTSSDDSSNTTGDDTNNTDDASASTGDDGSAPSGDGGPSTGDDGGPSTSSSGGYVRGPAPTSDSASKAGPYKTASYAANASVRSTKAYDVTNAHIYYPTDATAPFAAVAIVPGFTAAESSIAAWGPFLASYGIVVMTIGTSNPSTGAGDNSVLPPVRGDALLDALTTVKDENTRSGSPLSGKVDTSRLAVAGWSMGGGGTLIDANTHPELKAAMGLCPWNPNATYPNDTVPTFIFAGTADGLAGPPMPANQYDSIPSSTPKGLLTITNGSHFVANDPASENGVIGRFGLSWMKVFLEGDDRYKQFLTVQPSDGTLETNVK